MNRYLNSVLLLLISLSSLFLASIEGKIISVNIAFSETGDSAIDGDESFGVPSLNTVVGNWNNLKIGGSGMVADDGNATTVRIDLTKPNADSYFGAGYINTPMNFGLDHYSGTADDPGTTLSAHNLAAEFPAGYYVVAYVTGFVKNTGALITDGETSYYFQTLDPVPGSFASEDLIGTTLTSVPDDGQAPVAQYAVFGSTEEPLTSDAVTIRVDVLFGGGVGIGGMQIIGVDSGVDPNQTEFYLDAVNGDDNNDGATPETAWKNLKQLNLVTFKPGNQILFKRGDVFTGSFSLRGGGTPESPVIIGAYGSGAKPLLQGGEDDFQVILVGNSSGLEFRDLEISNYHPSGSLEDRHGISIIAALEAGELNHLHFHNLDFFNIQGSGTRHESRAIDAETATDDSARPLTRWNGFVVEDCTFENIDGRAIQLTDRLGSIADFKLRGFEYYPTVGVVIQNNVGLNLYRNFCQLAGTKDALIQHNYVEGTTEGSAFWPFDTDGTVVQFNDFRRLRKDGADAYVCHFDFNCIDTVMQYNFGYDVQGGLIQVIVNSQFDGFQENAIARYNVGVDVGWRDTTNGAGIFFTGRVTGSEVYNNTIISTGLYGSYKALSVNNWGGQWPDDNAMHNNLFLATGSPSGHQNDFRMGQLGNVVSHNLYYGNISAPGVDSAPVTGDPMIANAGSLDPVDLKVTSGSAAIGAGLIIPDNGGRDYFDNPVPSDAAPTIGFHEFQTDLPSTWAGYSIEANGYVDTGEGFLGWLWVGANGTGDSDWLFSATLHQYVFIQASSVSPGIGTWSYIPNINELLLGDAHLGWFYSHELGTWVYNTSEPVQNDSVWAYVIDSSMTP